jgi:LacI family transcriptional regulator
METVPSWDSALRDPLEFMATLPHLTDPSNRHRSASRQVPFGACFVDHVLVRFRLLLSFIMKEIKRPTIIDVARTAKVGSSTVSRHVRGGKSVSPDVARRIEIAIAQLGYEPNALARSLRVGRTQTLGVLFPHVNNVFFGNAIRTIQAEARTSGFTVMLLTHQEEAKLQQQQLASLKRSQVDGIILVPAAETNVAQVRALLANTPVVAFDRSLGSAVDSVMLDNYRAGRDATEHLLGHRHSHIVAVSASYKLHPLQSRLKGYNEAMGDSGKIAETIVWTGAEQLRSELCDVLRRKRRSATAILSISYSVTIAILSALRDSQISLSDVGFIGIDDMEFASFLSPPLTTIAQPAEEFARLAVQQLLRRIAGVQQSAAHVTLPGNLMVRASCGCKPSAPKKR